MTTAAASHVGPWTEENLVGLPDDGQRYELFEGSLLVSPPPTARHQRMSYKLASSLEACTPTGLVVVEATGVRLPGGSVFIPDVLVVDEAPAMADDSGILDADVVHLVVEIVSTGSHNRDRVTKPTLYAAAGISYFWRVEREEGPAVYAYRLDEGTYVQMAFARPGESLEVAEPFAVSLDPAALHPRAPR